MSTAKQDVADLKKDVEKLQNLLADQLAETLENGKSKTNFNAQDIAETVTEKARDVGKKSKELARTAGEKSRDAIETSRSTIKERPFLSTAAAFGAGALIATLFSKR